MPNVSDKLKCLCMPYIKQYKGSTASELINTIVQQLAKRDIHYKYKSIEPVVHKFWNIPKVIPQVTVQPTGQAFDPELPKSMAENYGVMELDGRDFLLIGDTQIPFHDELAIRTAVNSGKYDTIILMGNIIDCHSQSHFERDPRYRDFNFERLQLIQFYKYLRFHFPKEKIIFLEGNHEYRLTRWLWEHPEMYNIDEFQPSNILRCSDFNIEYVSGKTLKIGCLNLVHGHEIKGGGEQPAKNFVKKCMENIATFHFHKTQEWIEPKFDESIVGGWSVGCLCGLRPKWLPVNKWNHGFAHVKLLDNGKFEMYNKKIFNGVIY